MGQQIYGTSLLKHLDSIGVLEANLSLAHSIWIEDDDVELFARRGATPVHNPASNLRIGERSRAREKISCRWRECRTRDRWLGFE